MGESNMNKMPPVMNCDVENCYFNREQQCRAGAITVGSEEPRCETFAESSSHSHVDEQAEVGACHVTSCRYNEQMLCDAEGIDVVVHRDHADCETYEPR